MSRRMTMDESGFQLIELMVAATIMLVVLGAVLTALSSFEKTSRQAELQNDSQEEARRSLGNLVRELRNLASPTDSQAAIDRATPDDLVFQAVGPGGAVSNGIARRTRYCLKAGTLWREEQSPPGSLPTACPANGGGWSAVTVAAQHVVNEARPVFTYNSPTLSSISEISARVHIDTEPGERPGEATLESGAFLRNQNRAPSAVFAASAGVAEIVLDGSDSSDPEGQGLEYQWLEVNGGSETEIGTGPVFHYQAGAGTHVITLKVSDPAGLTNKSASKSVCLAGVLVSCP